MTERLETQVYYFQGSNSTCNTDFGVGTLKCRWLSGLDLVRVKLTPG